MHIWGDGGDHQQSSQPWKYLQSQLNRNNNDFNCKCLLFEFRGIIWRHSLVVLAQERQQCVLPKYVLQRWSKTIHRRHSYIRSSLNAKEKLPHIERFDAPPHNSTEYVSTEENIPTTQFPLYNESVRVVNAFQSQIKLVSCVFYLHDLILTFCIDLSKQNTNVECNGFVSLLSSLGTTGSNTQDPSNDVMNFNNLIPWQ